MVLLLDHDGRFLAGRGESLDRVLGPDTVAVGRRIEELFPDAEGVNALVTAIVLDVEREIDLAPSEPRKTDSVTGLAGRINYALGTALHLSG